MRSGSVAKRYALALIQVAQEDGKVDAYQKELEQLQELMRDNRELQTILRSPVVKPAAKKRIFQEMGAKVGLSPAVKHLIFVLIDQDRVLDLPLVTLIYRDMTDEILGQVRVLVTAAVPLGPQGDKLKGILEKRLKMKVLLDVKTDPEILGGLVVQIRDQVFDGSLMRELEKVKASIQKRAVA